YSNKYKRIKLLTQEKRECKASAVNEFMQNARNEICVLESADTIPFKKTIEKICTPFLNNSVGVTGGHPIPINDRTKFMGFVGHLLWELHHEIALESPKLGEIIAFRNLAKSIPKETAVDEAWIEADLRKRGYSAVYVRGAYCYNRTPETISDYIKQRRRIQAGHIMLKNQLDYTVSTMSISRILKFVLKKIKKNPSQGGYIIGAIILEMIARILGYYDHYIKKNRHVIWKIASSTKELSE
ncbi:MAG: glycosyltransferase family 2 protein, partial [Candidatus Helarchaeales archaeon]